MAHMHLSLSQRPLTAMHVYHRTSLGCPRETRIIHDSSEQDHIIEALQHYNSLYTNYIRVKSAEVLHIIIYKPFVPNLTNLKFSYYNHCSGVALVTLLQTTETDCSAQEPHNLLVVAYRENNHAAGSETDLLHRRTCNKGLTNPEYKSTPQDLTDEKGGE
jgi:hypothetical protein